MRVTSETVGNNEYIPMHGNRLSYTISTYLMSISMYIKAKTHTPTTNFSSQDTNYYFMTKMSDSA